MKDELDYIIGSMHHERLYDWSESAKAQIAHAPFLELNPEFPSRLRNQYRELLDSRYLSVRDYVQITGVQFRDEDALYEFLEKSYKYIFDIEKFDEPPYPELG
ncbi:hypothetical protein ACWDOP_30785 [Nocardia sp. NPDC003693]